MWSTELIKMFRLKLKSGKYIEVSTMDAIKGTIWEEKLDKRDLNAATKKA